MKFNHNPGRTACLLLALSAVFSAGGVVPYATTFALDSGYPGPAPGAARVEFSAGRITVANNAFSWSWTLATGRFRNESIRDNVSNQATALQSEAFQIILTNGERYAASALLSDGAPRIAELTPQPQASQLQARIPGRQIEVPLTTPDGRLRIVWRALLRDGANFARQEISITPQRQNVVIREIVWLEEKMPSARTAGRVEGSPVTSGNFFFGCEDPMALNAAETVRERVGAWSGEDLDAGKRRTKVWPLSQESLQTGSVEVRFDYERGPHRLDVWRVALRENGQEVAQDTHHGRSGSEHVDNSYTLRLARPNPSARYELAAEVSTDPALKLPAGQRVDSQGTVFQSVATGRVVCRLRREAPLRQGESLAVSFVLGVSPPDQMRRAFLYYLERERAHPYRPFLHYNSWYDIAWHPFALNETNCLEAIRLFGDRFIKPYDVTMDALVFDDGWDNPKTLWQFHRGFPQGFTPLAALAKQYHTQLGVWLSPFGGYGDSRDQRLKAGREQGYEINAAGFSLAGPKYYAAFKNACVRMIREYGVNHFKFDGIATGSYANGAGAEYILDTEAMRRLMLELRHEDPNVYINLTTGSWPSPFWLRYADSVWRQGGDMGLAGKGPKQQQWLTYRDQETYRNIVGKGPLYPLNSLMTQGVAYSREGTAGEPSFNSAGFKDDVRAFFGSGTGLQELYIQPGKLTEADWKVLAEAAKWSRANASVLVDTHWIGGDPAKLEVYGYAAWTAAKATVMLRNPDDQPHTFALEVRSAFQLPPGAPGHYRLHSPWAEDAGQPALTAAAGEPLRIWLKPFEVAVWDAVPAP